MKIAFSGPTCTGKSTVAKIVSEKLNIPYVESTSKQLALKYKIKPEAIDSKEFLIKFQSEVIDLKIYLENSFSTFITDRSYIDSYAYARKAYIINRWAYDEFLDNYKHKCLTLNQKYDIIFKFPIGIPLINNDIRQVDETTNQLTNGIINELLLNFDNVIYIPVEKFIIGKPEIVADYVISRITKLMTSKRIR